jgi:AcrR family transcriptional regulator
MNVSKDQLARQEIVDNAQILFRQFGLKKTTMDEIAESCGKAKSTLYHYFKSKEQVFVEVITKEKNTLRAMIISAVDKESDYVSKIKAYFIAFFAGIENRVNLYRIIKKEMKANQQFIIDLLDSLIADEKDFLINLINSGIENNSFKKMTKDEVSGFVELLLAALVGIINHFYIRKDNFNTTIFDKALDIMVSGIVENNA